MKTNIAVIQEFNEKQNSDVAWDFVLECLNTVITLDKVNQKPINRTGKVMRQALINLFDSIRIYDKTRNK